MKDLKKDLILVIIWLGVIIIMMSWIIVSHTDIVSTKLIEPYKVVLTKVDGKVVKTYYYKQN